MKKIKKKKKRKMKKRKKMKKKMKKMYILFGRGRNTSHPSSDWFNSYNIIS